MYRENSIAAVVPAHNEETQIGRVIETMPEFVDKIIVVDDRSRDNTAGVVGRYEETDERVVLIRHDVNQGVGGAIATGYKWARDHEYDVAVVMAGDGQMDPADLPALLDPIVNGEADYSKGNRLLDGSVFREMPKIRYLGNAALSMLTKIASGYWQVADSQNGYTAINLAALKRIRWDEMYKRYGQPNDLLVKLNVHGFRVTDVYMKPVYNVGERSGISIPRVTLTIGWLLLRLFLWRVKEKYIIRDFHPLVFFYLLGFGLLGCCGLLAVKLVYLWVEMGYAPLFFAMWFDKETANQGAAYGGSARRTGPNTRDRKRRRRLRGSTVKIRVSDGVVVAARFASDGIGEEEVLAALEAAKSRIQARPRSRAA